MKPLAILDATENPRVGAKLRLLCCQSMLAWRSAAIYLPAEPEVPVDGYRPANPKDRSMSC